uniref:Uncharacterized protein n=1 Tax=Myoviridae sp. cte0t5 TaxID=2823549 RepID=A0A8S5LGY4_9CAUD|nr:MAG TPA: hypothetical protein [Myoviridae sp. cte0t5]
MMAGKRSGSHVTYHTLAVGKCMLGIRTFRWNDAVVC